MWFFGFWEDEELLTFLEETVATSCTYITWGELLVGEILASLKVSSI
jgi:hypothetical protein